MMKRGIVKTIILYSIGLALTVLTYFIFGPGYAHGPGPYILIPFFTVTIGVLWTGATIFNYYVESKTEERKGMIWSQLVILLMIAGVVFYFSIRNTLPETDTGHKDTMILSEDGDTTSLTYNGTVIYLKVKDSVHFDRRDSLDRKMK